MKFDMPPDAVPESVNLEVDLQTQPVAASIVSGLEYLVDFPYGCVEQTMSRFMPTITARETLKRFNVGNDKLTGKVEECIAKGLYKLYGYQHDDGGWGWWKDDATNSFLTAYVMYGLAKTRQAGYDIKDQVIQDGLKNLEATIPQEQDLQLKSFMVMAYAYSKKPKAEWLDALFAQRDKMGNFGIAALLIAAHKADQKQYYSPLLKLIEERIRKQENMVCWETQGMKLTSGTIQSTAFILQALMMTDPKNELIPKAADYLLNLQKGGRWSTTKDSSAAIQALSRYLSQIKIKDEKPIGSFALNGEVKNKFDLKGDKLTENIFHCGMESLTAGENKATLTCQKDITYGFSSRFSYRSLIDSRKMLDNGLKITRKYFTTSLTGMKIEVPDNGSIKTGEILEVELTVEAALPESRYLMLEDYFPAGCEVVEGKDPSSRTKRKRSLISHREVRDERMVFFVTNVPDKPFNITYLLRAETPGKFSANPCSGELMYHPEINGHSKMTSLEILKKQE